MSSLKVGVITTALFFQREGGMQRQVKETMAALNVIGVDARPFRAAEDQVGDFDLIHVFDLEGNVEDVIWGARLGVPIVFSPVIDPTWTNRKRIKAAFADKLVRRLTQSRVRTSFGDTVAALSRADRVVALGAKEHRVLTQIFACPADRIRLLPNGVSARFFDANPSPFCEHYGVAPGFVLCVGTIYPHKNQLLLAQALEGIGIPLILIGGVLPGQESYLKKVTSFDHVIHLGPIPHEDPLLPSAYAASGVFALVSESEVMPLVVLEALAAGTPAVLTNRNSLDVHLIESGIREVDPAAPIEVRDAILEVARERANYLPSRTDLESLSWEALGKQLAALYREVVDERRKNLDDNA